MSTQLKHFQSLAALVPQGRLSRALVMLCACAIASSAALAESPSDRTREYAIKSAFLYNFTKFVEWPADAQRTRGEEFSVCVRASGDVISVIRGALAHKTTDDMPVRVVELQNAAQVPSCHILFVEAAERDLIPDLCRRGLEAGTLVVSEAKRFGATIGMINLVLIENRVQLEVVRERTDGAGLVLSSHLLSLAKLRAAEDLTGQGGQP